MFNTIARIIANFVKGNCSMVNCRSRSVHIGSGPNSDKCKALGGPHSYGSYETVSGSNANIMIPFL